MRWVVAGSARCALTVATTAGEEAAPGGAGGRSVAHSGIVGGCMAEGYGCLHACWHGQIVFERIHLAGLSRPHPQGHAGSRS